MLWSGLYKGKTVCICLFISCLAPTLLAAKSQPLVNPNQNQAYYPYELDLKGQPIYVPDTFSLEQAEADQELLNQEAAGNLPQNVTPVKGGIQYGDGPVRQVKILEIN